MNKDDLAARLLSIFLGELEEQIRSMNANLLALEAQPEDATHLRVLFRAAHTLKGAAGAAGVPLIEEVCHALEALLAQARDGKIVLGRDEFSLLFSAVDALQDAGERIRAGGSLGGSPLAALARTARGAKAPHGGSPAARLPPSREARPSPSGPTPDTTLEPPGGATARVPGRPGAEPALGRKDPGAAGGAAEARYVRVEAEKLGALLASAGQMRVATTGVSTRSVELQELHDAAARSLAEWSRTRHYLRVALRETRAPGTVLQSLERVEESLERLVQQTSGLAADSVADARIVSRLAGEIGHRALQLRLRPFADACEALPRVVRDVASAAGKEARFEVHGGEVEADRAVLQGLGDALLHLVRNAVDHGIEPPAIREKAGKPRAGTVHVSASLRGDRLAVTVTDDGGGIDLAAIRNRLRQRGQPAPGGEGELVDLLFEGGFSTLAEATEISGRGVGLDVVRSALDWLHGTVAVKWTEGSGATFVLECPLTLATSRVLLVRVGSQTLAIPTADIERLTRVRPEEIRRAEGRDVIPTAEAPVPLVALARLLGPPLVEQPVSGPLSVVKLLAGGRRLAIMVDELIAEQEVVVRPVERIRTLPAYLSGAAILSRGGVALVLNPAALVATGLDAPAGAGIARAESTLIRPSRRRVLVADDSISTRTLEQSILEAAGYEVLTAVDGADAWRVLQEQGADLVVSDVEMPRMDGFALCEAIRASKRLNALPVVLVTALETPEHRARGLEAGADAYLAKSSFDQENLLDTIRELIG